MEPNLKTQLLRISGMTCINCQNRIEKKLRATAGIMEADVSFASGTANITYDTNVASFKDIVYIVENLGYTMPTDGGRQTRFHKAGILLAIFCLFLFLQGFGPLNALVPSQLAETNMGFGMLFIVGLFTSVHCIAMCGGINLSQCIPKGSDKNAAFAPAFLYNLGRVASYTVVGFVLGSIGMLFSGGSGMGMPVAFQGALKLAAGALMVVMGLNMLGLFPWLRKFNPRMPKIFARKIDESKSAASGPLIVGLLNGLMPCGPLQSMQIVALASGGPIAGALSMLAFSLGTVPLMLGFGSFISALGKKFTGAVINAGAALVVALGMAMFVQGGSLTGFLPPAVLAPLKWARAEMPSNIQIVDGKQTINSDLSPGKYPNITVRAGVPVKWVIDAPKGSINGCNNRIIIQEYGIEHTFEPGENIIEFTPERTGKFPYSCWMGMIHGSITVKV